MRGRLLLIACMSAATGCGASVTEAPLVPGETGAAAVDGASSDGLLGEDGAYYCETGGGWADAAPAWTLYVSFENDRRTAVGYDDPAVTVLQYAGDASAGSSEVDAVVSKLTLRTWPELVEVPGAAIAGATSGTGSGWTTRVAFHPTTPLEDRWYLLSLRDAPKDWAVTGGLQPGGLVGGRFRTGSEPRLAGFYVETMAPSAGKVYVRFTEPVSASGDVAKIVTLTQPGLDTKCYSYGGGPAELGLRCVLTPGVALQVSIGVGLFGTAPPNPSVASKVYDFDIAERATLYMME